MKKILNIILIFTTAGFLSLQGRASLPEAYNEIDFYEDDQEELIVQIEKDQEEPLFEEFQVAVEPITASVLAGWFVQGLIYGAGTTTGGLIVGKIAQEFTKGPNPNDLRLYFDFLESKGKVIKYYSFDEMPPKIENVVRDRFGEHYFRRWKWIKYTEEGLNGLPMLENNGVYVEIYEDLFSIDGDIFWIGRWYNNKRRDSALQYKNGKRFYSDANFDQHFKSNSNPNNPHAKGIVYTSFKNMPDLIINVVKERYGENVFKDHRTITYVPAGEYHNGNYYDLLLIGRWGHWDVPKIIEFYDNGAWSEKNRENKYTGVTSKTHRKSYDRPFDPMIFLDANYRFCRSVFYDGFCY